MMKKLKLMTIVGTRPEMIKLSEVIKVADQCFDHIFVHTGQNYDKNLKDIFYEDLGLRQPDYYLDVVGNHLGETIGNVVAKSYECLQKFNPDALLILGDTNSALSAIAAKRLKIPVFHMEAGNRCFDENLPEEVNRRMIDHIADVNLPYTEHARRYLLSEGVKPEYVYVTGSPTREVLEKNFEKIKNSTILEKLELESKKYFLLSAHREENIDSDVHFISLMNAMNTLAEKYHMPIIYSVHPRAEKKIEEMQFAFHPLIRKMSPFSFSDYNKLQTEAFCVVSDSGTLAEESAILGFPAVSIRTSTERPEALEQGGFIVGGISEDEILQAVETEVFLGKNKHPNVQDYSYSDVSIKVIKLIQSYTERVNQNVWHKEAH